MACGDDAPVLELADGMLDVVAYPVGDGVEVRFGGGAILHRLGAQPGEEGTQVINVADLIDDQVFGRRR